MTPVALRSKSIQLLRTGVSAASGERLTAQRVYVLKKKSGAKRHGAPAEAEVRCAPGLVPPNHRRELPLASISANHAASPKLHMRQSADL